MRRHRCKHCLRPVYAKKIQHNTMQQNRKQRRKAEQAAVKAQQLPEMIPEPPEFSDQLEAGVEEKAVPVGRIGCGGDGFCTQGQQIVGIGTLEGEEGLALGYQILGKGLGFAAGRGVGHE